MKKTLDKNQKIIFSVVVCTFNREKWIAKCIDSLLRLDYPKDEYEIIVVDDGSTDSTVEIVKKYPVKLVIHKNNQGTATARNTGLKNAKGKIYVCFDDDCHANKDWLKNLDFVYKQNNINKILGVAGFVKLTGKSGVIEKYMDETGYANPSPVYYVKNKNIFARFYAYIKNMFFPNIEAPEQISEVGEIWGANCSFPVNVLNSVGGWDEKMSGVEDTDLCSSLIKKFNNRKFLCTKNAALYHDHRLTLSGFLKKPYSRGTAILKLYIKKSEFPPIFPFPILIAVVFFVLLFLAPLYAFVSLMFLPQILYSWFLIKAIKKRKVYYLLFPYLQSSYELSTILGLLRGYIVLKKQT